MLYVIPAGTKVIARKSEAGHETVRNFTLREQLTFGDDDLMAEHQNPRALVFNNGAWSLTARRTDVQTY